MATVEQVQELREKMAEERARLVAQVEAIDDETASRMPVNKQGEEQWTVKEQLAHLCEMELSYDAWVRAAVAGDNPNVAGVRGGPARIPIEEANEHSVAELLQVMADERADTLRMLDGLSLDDYDRTATQPMFGTLTVLQWLRSFYRHDRMHSDQIAGREPEYKPRFTGSEPDQRTPRLKAKQSGG